MKRTKKIVGLSLFVLMVLSTSVSCVMDRVSSVCLKNCTKDSLLMDLASSDTLSDWESWGFFLYVMSENDTSEIDDVSSGVDVDCLVPSDSVIRFTDPYMYYDTCYIYTIKWSVAKNYPMDVIRKKKLYDRRIVTKKDFHDHLLEYRYACPTGVMK